MKGTRINIATLKKGENQLSMIINDDFFKYFPVNNIDSSAYCDNCSVDCIIEKSNTLIKINFKMSIEFTFVCDVTCKKFQETIVKKDFILVKFSTNDINKNDTIYPNGDEKIKYINKDTGFIDMAQEFYDIIVTSIPMKKLDFSIRNNVYNENEFLYQTKDDNNKNIVDEPKDERFATLKKLLNK